MNKNIVVGLGEVGSAIQQIFTAEGHDWKSGSMHERQFDYLHICFPYSDSFVDDVKEYQRLCQPKYTIVHSSVPVGTSRKCDAIHSPVRGLHPNLERGVRTFSKFIGGKDASNVADLFRRVGLKVILFDKQETTEAMKLFDTQYYLECVRFCKRVKEFCDANELNFHEVYTLGNHTYNEGYAELGHKEYVRPVLQPIMTEIGGHCLLPNEVLLENTGVV